MYKIQYDFYKNHKLVLDKKIYYKKGLSGIVNIGNKCYSNSIIQCLSHTIKLTDYFLSCKFKQDVVESHLRSRPKFNTVLCYVGLLNKLWTFNELIQPSFFYDNIKLNIKKYNNNNQHDSHEFLIDLLDLFHNVLSYKINVNISGEIKNEHDKLMMESLVYWKNLYKNNYSEIVKIFHGLTLNIIQCNNCKYESENIFESYNSLNININNSNLLNECIEKYFNEFTIHDWKCDKCNSNGCNKSLKLWTIPDYLIIHLKRFDSNGNKINQYIDFPIDDFDLTKYITKKKRDPNNYIYSLYAINNHEGSSRSGHYWSSIKNIDDKWYKINDGHVSKYNNNSDLKTQLITSNAYILFYYRKYINNG